MRTHSDSDVQQIRKSNCGGPGRRHSLFRFRGKNRELISTPFDPDLRRSVHGRPDLLGRRARRRPESQRSESIAMHCNIGVGRIGIQVLTNHQDYFSMSACARAGEASIGGSAHFSVHTLPDEMENVGGTQMFAPPLAELYSAEPANCMPSRFSSTATILLMVRL